MKAYINNNNNILYARLNYNNNNMYGRIIIQVGPTSRCDDDKRRELLFTFRFRLENCRIYSILLS